MLALAYAADLPARCLGLLLRGLWCLGPCELGWNYEDRSGKALYFPREHQALVAASLVEGAAGSLVSRFHHLVTSATRPWEARVAAARALSLIHI